ncbi:MAG: indolepyruvate ferredoxin oxidoreductase subunit alpha [Candidatus Jordarchaeum sp.]|uniref:indolepyruvate ferredoxin oxidoreductase subunit alpha n=1 Tax=Candidatus Jordarchaeum sp. TaxID=2823881 RepID=UPI004049F977
MKFNYPVLVNPEKCQHCGTCKLVCPLGAIKEIDPRFKVDISKCATRIDCFSCVMHCKSHALVLKQGDIYEKINIPMK